MPDAFHIFRKVPGSSPIWVHTVTSLEKARAHIVDVESNDPGEYSIFDASQSRFVE